MVKRTDEKLVNLLEDIEVDKLGIVRLEDWQGTPLWDKARKLLPGAKSAIVLAMEVFPEVVDHLTSKVQVGELALRDLYRRNEEMVNGLLNWEAYKIVKRLHEQGFQGVPLPASEGPYDGRFLEGPLSYKHLAQAAGLGVLGWHSLLITLEYGPRVRLACVITNAPLAPSPPTDAETPCSKCKGACVKVCPAGAIIEPQKSKPYHVDKYACNAYLSASGLCAECLKVCPAGRKS